MLKRILVYTLFSFVVPFSIMAQHLEIGINMGGANYWGDLAPSVVMKETHFSYGFFARLNLSSSFAFTAAINNGTVSGDDKNFEYNKPRNLNFTTPFKEYSGVVEFNFFKFGPDVLDKRFSPYVFWGLGFTQFDPQADVNGEMVQLRNIQTENQSYGSTVMCMPFGMGFKWQFARHFACETNINFRRVFSDYLDDVSTVYPDNNETFLKKGVIGAYLTDPSSAVNNSVPLFSKGDRRGNQDYTDWYVTTTVSISYRFYKRTKCRRFY